MNSKQRDHYSKFLSLVLRHKPETINLALDAEGWALVEDLLAKMNAYGESISLAELKEVVHQNAKKRFAFSEDGQHIRASQGHSLKVDLKLHPQKPPALLYHGTAQRNLESIYKKGLVKGERQYVHLSSNRETALAVGQRYGKPIILKVNTEAMQADGLSFYKSENDVWLCDYVAPTFLELDE